ncbi:MAG TPA: hypothetical protein V6C81_29760 [Planktothrix sp.]
MRLLSSAAGIMAALTVVPLMVPSASAACSKTKTVSYTTRRVYNNRVVSYRTTRRYVSSLPVETVRTVKTTRTTYTTALAPAVIRPVTAVRSVEVVRPAVTAIAPSPVVIMSHHDMKKLMKEQERMAVVEPTVVTQPVVTTSRNIVVSPNPVIVPDDTMRLGSGQQLIWY